ncbi:glycosyl hydrolase 2 galactose-binding domain-containing protein [Edwardsiella tarda]|uniref:glycoside hydrolase family 2 protein n=1 Tax=Edwardsiella tarda TaxID=636 RepID=UPI003B508C49
MSRCLSLPSALLLILIPLTGTTQTLSLDGAWRTHDANPPFDTLATLPASASAWRTLRVPANWYSQGLDHQGALWYQREFTLPPLAADRMATLIFNGVDYRADIWLNRRYLGAHQGYFQRFALDGSEALQRHNRLLVRVDSPFEAPGTVWPLHKRLIKGILNQHDTRPGGAWSPQGQDANSGGIWQPVRLKISRRAAIDNLLLTPRFSADGRQATLNLRLDYRAQAAMPATLTLRMIPYNFVGRHYRLTVPVTLQRDGTLEAQMALPRVTRWWPDGYGYPALYQVRVALNDDHGMMDDVQQVTGIRQFRQDVATQAWYINGKRIFLRGTNYIASPWLGQVSAADYRRDLLLMKRAHINTVRIHAHVAGQALYRQADELGMMLWQDMPLQWGYDDSPAFAAEAARQATALVRQFGSHPAIIVWVGQNEPPFNAPWMKEMFADWQPNLNRQLAQRVADALGQDSSRGLHPWSRVDEHFWQGWYFGKISDVLKPAYRPIITEFGAQALPALPTLMTIIPPADRWPASTDPRDPAWRVWMYHNFQPSNTFGLAGVKRGKDLASFIYNTQLNQAHIIQLAGESYRRQRFRPVTTLMQFMFSESWPSMNWAVVDYTRQPKPGYFALQRAFQPILPSIEPITLTWRVGQPGHAALWAINDTWRAHPASRLVWQLRQGGVSLEHGELRFDLPADSGQKLRQIQATPRDQQDLWLYATLYDAQGKTLGENSYRFEVAAP